MEIPPPLGVTILTRREWRLFPLQTNFLFASKMLVVCFCASVERIRKENYFSPQETADYITFPSRVYARTFFSAVQIIWEWVLPN
jgi:hypothetical protein